MHIKKSFIISIILIVFLIGFSVIINANTASVENDCADLVNNNGGCVAPVNPGKGTSFPEGDDYCSQNTGGRTKCYKCHDDWKWSENEFKCMAPCDTRSTDSPCSEARFIFASRDLSEVQDYYNSILTAPHLNDTIQTFELETGGQCHCLSCKTGFNWRPLQKICDYETQTCREEHSTGIIGACASDQMSYTDFLFTSNWYSNFRCISPENPLTSFPEYPYYYTCCPTTESNNIIFYTRQEVEVY